MFFREPQQLLSIFTDLEDENLGLIQKCQEAEDAAEAVKKRTGDAKSKLNELESLARQMIPNENQGRYINENDMSNFAPPPQVVHFEGDIARLQTQIGEEKVALDAITAELSARAGSGETTSAAAAGRHLALSDEDRTLIGEGGREALAAGIPLSSMSCDDGLVTSDGYFRFGISYWS